MPNIRINKFLSLIKESLLSYLSIAFWFLLIAFDIRLLETILLTVSKGEFWLNCLNNFYGIFIDILIFLRYSLLIFPIFLLINTFSKKGAKWFLRILFSLFVLISIALIYYYLTAGIPLDKVFIMYSLNDIIDIAVSSKSMTWWEYVIIIGFPLAFLYVSGKEIKIPQVFIYILLVVFILSFIIKDVPSKLYKSYTSYYTISNKFNYFIKSIFTVEKNSKLDFSSIDQAVLKFQSYFPENDFLGTEYPFLHVDKSPDVLSEFFDFTDELPNFVVIIVEGLGRTICGENSLYPSATQFLDSIAAEGLYWENCFSSSHRTLNVLPTVFGALPFGEKGFMDLKNSAPEFNSFPLIYKDNGYELSFFYGGWIGFDDMNYFLELNKFDNYIDKEIYKTHEERNSWGLYDHVVFNEAFKILDFSNNKSRLDVYLTLTTHAPFEYPNKDYYTEKYQNIVQRQNQTISKNALLERASFMYLDDCLRNLMNMYKEKSGYNNTVFMITGDHNYTGSKDYWRTCHVPLIIWSPMIKEPKKISALVSHRDIAPSLVSLMKNKFNFITPENVTWLNTGLDTVSYFRSKTFTPQFNVMRVLSDVIYHDKFIYKNQIGIFNYENNVLSLDKFPYDQNLLNLYDLYKNIDKYVIENDMLIKNEFTSANYNIINIYDITETKDVLGYYKSKTKIKSKTYHGKEHTLYFVNIKYPFNILNYEIPDDILNIKVEFGFDLFIKNTTAPKLEKQIFIVTEIKDKENNSKYWGQNKVLNTHVYNKYDDWQSFSFTFDFKKKNYFYSGGDILNIYIWNSYLNDFYISNFYLKVDLYKEKP